MLQLKLFWRACGGSAGLSVPQIFFSAVMANPRTALAAKRCKRRCAHNPCMSWLWFVCRWAREVNARHCGARGAVGSQGSSAAASLLPKAMDQTRTV
jgi:hypothetical protein